MNENDYYVYDDNGNVYSLEPNFENYEYYNEYQKDDIFNNNFIDKFLFFKKSSMNILDLIEETKLRKSISSDKNFDNFIQIKDWDYIIDENNEVYIEKEFKILEEFFFSIKILF